MAAAVASSIKTTYSGSVDMSGSSSESSDLDVALSYMNRTGTCPEEIRARIAILRVPRDEGVTNRVTSNWRRGGGGTPAAEDGPSGSRSFGGGRYHGGGGHGGGGVWHGSAH